MQKEASFFFSTPNFVCFQTLSHTQNVYQVSIFMRKYLTEKMRTCKKYIYKRKKQTNKLKKKKKKKKKKYIYMHVASTFFLQKSKW